MTPAIGQLVLYTLSEQDAKAISLSRSHTDDPAVHGNPVKVGDVFPAFVVRVFPGGTEVTGVCNLKVQLDGHDTYWATSRTPGDGEFHWAWPQFLV